MLWFAFLPRIPRLALALASSCEHTSFRAVALGTGQQTGAHINVYAFLVQTLTIPPLEPYGAVKPPKSHEPLEIVRLAASQHADSESCGP